MDEVKYTKSGMLIESGAEAPIATVLKGMARAAKQIGEEARATGVKPFDDVKDELSFARETVVKAFNELDGFDESMDDIKAEVSVRYAVLDAAGIPKKEVKLARKVALSFARETVVKAFNELDGFNESMDDIKAEVSVRYAVLDAAGIPKKEAKLARQVASMTVSQRRAFDAALTLARQCLGVQAEQIEMELGEMNADAVPPP